MVTPAKISKHVAKSQPKLIGIFLSNSLAKVSKIDKKLIEFILNYMSKFV